MNEWMNNSEGFKQTHKIIINEFGKIKW